MTGSYPATARTTARRNRQRVNYDRTAAHAILDEAHFCSFAFVAHGAPRVLPTLHVRVDEQLYLHASTGSTAALTARSPAGLPVCVSVTVLDALVLARSHFHHSVNYRSVVAHGDARLVTNESEKASALTALVDKIAPGRAADSRPPTAAELAATAVLALPLREVSVKVRSGGVADEPADADLPYWAGVVPLATVTGPPRPDHGVTVPVPTYLR